MESMKLGKIGANYFTIGTQDYLLIVDYFSKYPEVIPVTSKSVDATVQAMKAIFARHGIPRSVIADNMPFNSKMFNSLQIRGILLLLHLVPVLQNAIFKP